MKKLRNISLLVALMSILFTSCDCIEGQGPLVTEEYAFSDINGIILDVPAFVKITEGKTDKVIVSTQANILDVISLEETGSGLRIKSNVPCIRKSDITIELSMEQIEKLHVRGSGTIKCIGVFENEDLELEIDGSGTIYLDTESEDINIQINGSGDIYLEGEAEKLDISVNGSGTLKAYDLKVDVCEVVINGSGDCNLYVTDELDVTVRGSGDVHYQGSPDVNTRVSGSGAVKRK